jgi:hypothetical protein
MNYQELRNKKFNEIAKELKLKELKVLLDSIYELDSHSEVSWQTISKEIQVIEDSTSISKRWETKQQSDERRKQ